MILDNFLQVSTAQAVTATAVSTNSIDLGLPLRDMGVGKSLRCVISCDVAAVTAVAAKY